MSAKPLGLSAHSCTLHIARHRCMPLYPTRTCMPLHPACPCMLQCFYQYVMVFTPGIKGISSTLPRGPHPMPCCLHPEPLQPHTGHPHPMPVRSRRPAPHWALHESPSAMCVFLLLRRGVPRVTFRIWRGSGLGIGSWAPYIMGSSGHRGPSQVHAPSYP